MKFGRIIILKQKGKSIIVHYDYLKEKSIRIPNEIRLKLNKLYLKEEDIGKK